MCCIYMLIAGIKAAIMFLVLYYFVVDGMYNFFNSKFTTIKYRNLITSEYNPFQNHINIFSRVSKRLQSV